MNYWLMKSEPEAYSIDDLIQQPQQTDYWDGVRNYQARNMLRDAMKKDDLAFFYHSNCKVPGIVGIMKIVHQGYPDDTQFDPKSKYYDIKAVPDKPRWYRVDVKFIEKFPAIIPLTDLKANPALSQMPLVQKGNRLSIMPVTEVQWHAILAMS